MTKLVYFQGWGKWNAYQNLRGIYLEIYHNSRNNTLNWIREALGYTIKWLIQSNKNHVSVTNQFIMCRNQELSLIILWKNNPDTHETSLIPLHFKIFNHTSRWLSSPLSILGNSETKDYIDSLKCLHISITVFWKCDIHEIFAEIWIM